MQKNQISIFLGFLLSVVTLSCNSQKSVPDDNKKESTEFSLTTKADSVSYSIGKNIGGDLKQKKYDWNVDAIAHGIQDAIDGNDSLITFEQAQQLLMNLQTELSGEAAKKGKAFLEENKKKEGVKVTDDGLQYKVLKEGTGPKPSPTDKVTVHYKGTLVDGTIFDSSYDRGEPVVFQVNRVIPGWQEGLQLMKEGAKYMLYIPSDLAYGERGMAPKIGPNETLIFEVELLKVSPSEDQSK